MATWADPIPNSGSPYTSDSAHAPNALSNGLLNSVAELGNVFDPVQG